MFGRSRQEACLAFESKQCDSGSQVEHFQSSQSMISPVGCGLNEEEITVKLWGTYVTGRRGVERYHRMHRAVCNTLFKVQWLVLYWLSSHLGR